VAGWRWEDANMTINIGHMAAFGMPGGGARASAEAQMGV